MEMLEIIESFFEDYPAIKYFVSKIIQVVIYVIIKPFADYYKQKLQYFFRYKKPLKKNKW